MKALNQATGKLIRFLHIYQSMVIGALGILFSTVMLLNANKIAVIKSSVSAVDNAAFLPRIVFWTIIVISVAFIMGKGQIAANRQTAPDGEELEKAAHGVLRSLGALLMLFVYIICFSRLGFVISSIIYMIALMTYMTKKEDRKPVVFVIVSVALTLIVYFCFKKYLYNVTFCIKQQLKVSLNSV